MSVPGGCAIGTPPSNIPPPGAAISDNASLSVVNLTLVSLQCVKKDTIWSGRIYTQNYEFMSASV